MNMEDESLGFFLLGMFIGALITLIVVVVSAGDIDLSQDAADKACQEISKNVSAVAVRDVNKFRLICELPSYDHTQDIIIRSAGEK